MDKEEFFILAVSFIRFMRNNPGIRTKEAFTREMDIQAQQALDERIKNARKVIKEQKKQMLTCWDTLWETVDLSDPYALRSDESIDNFVTALKQAFDVEPDEKQQAAKPVTLEGVEEISND